MESTTVWDLAGYAAIAACVVIILLPPRYDPAIRLKEWLGTRQAGRRR